MSVSTVGTTISYAGNGVTTSFPYPFKFYTSTDLIVTTAVGVPPVYTPAAGFAIVGQNVVFSVAPPLGTTIIIYSAIPDTQPTSYTYQDNFPAASHEAALDRLTMLVQQLENKLLHTLRVPQTDPSIGEMTIAARVGSVLGFDGNGNLTYVNSGSASGTTNVGIVNFTGGAAGCLDFVAITPYAVGYILTIQPGGPGNALVRVQKVNTTSAPQAGVIITPPDYNAVSNPYQWVTVG